MPSQLTKSKIDSTVPTHKEQFVWDQSISGFGLKISPSGRKTFLLVYRMGGRDTPTRRYTLGTYGSITPDMARKEAIRLRGLIASGTDPMELRAQAKTQLSFGEFAKKYLKEHACLHKKPSSLREDQRNLNKHLLPILDNKPLEIIVRADIAKIHQGLRDSPIAANRCLSLLTTMFNLSERWGYRPDNTNPCRHITRFKENKRQRFLSSEELARLGQVLSKAEQANTHSPFVLALFRLLILTGARLGEILFLKWDQVNLKERCLHLSDSKTGPKTIHLNAPSLTVLDGLPRMEGNPFVCAGKRQGKGLVGVHHSWYGLRKTAGLSDVRIHDLRHSFASVGVSSGTSLYVIGSLLGHTLPATTARYAHLHTNPQQVASEDIAQQILAAMNPPTEEGEVVSLTKKKYA